jgi:hypothetical protein
MPTMTYEPIETQTLVVLLVLLHFSSISSTYTDLVFGN